MGPIRLALEKLKVLATNCGWTIEEAADYCDKMTIAARAIEKIGSSAHVVTAGPEKPQ